MDLPNLKDLKAVLQLCRKQGVTDIKLGELEIKFGELPEEKAVEETETALGPSDEDMAYWSTAPDPLTAVMDKQ